MKVELETDIVIVTPSRDLGSIRHQEFHLEIGRTNDLLRQGGFQKLLIDLAERRRIEKVLLTALVGFCRTIPGAAAFCNVSSEIRNLMQTAGLLGLWPSCSNRAEAITVLTSLGPPTGRTSARLNDDGAGPAELKNGSCP